MRLDRFLVRRGVHSGKEIKRLLEEKRVAVNGTVEVNGIRRIDRFTRIELDGKLLQSHEAVYVMLHKPAGYLSATCDPLHPTVLDLIQHPSKEELHLAGRLDRATTGLVLLTNDGRWSKGITEPIEEISKVYRVETRDPISPETTAIFAKGIYFAYENLTTRPAQLEILSDYEALLTLHEGRYHQVKRMFHAVGNQVVKLHRQSIGRLTLGESLREGAYRHLSSTEVSWFRRE